MPLKKGDTVVHALKEGPLLSAVTTVAKELGLTVSTSTDTKNARLAIVDSPPSVGKLAKCLGPKAAVVACSGNAEGATAGASAALSVTDLIFNDAALLGFDLASFIASENDKTLAAGV